MSDSRTERLIEISNWLDEQPFVRRFKTGKPGFFLRRGTRVRSQSVDSDSMDVLDWLRAEGFAHGVSVGAFNIVYHAADSPFGEALYFFKATDEIIEVPFLDLPTLAPDVPLSPAIGGCVPIAEDEIPF